ncbi:MAG: hypothetical protein LBS03_06560, partial [Bacteroidales bacterium]|nr:hypothetical protein [Bacteroidales bacterium]
PYASAYGRAITGTVYHAKSRRDNTLLTVCFSFRTRNHGHCLSRKVPQGQHFINRMLQLTDAPSRALSISAKSRRDNTLLTVCFSLRTRHHGHCLSRKVPQGQHFINRML